MTFIDISYRVAIKATCTNRKCNISDLGATSSFAKNLWAHLIGHLQCVGICVIIFIRTSNRLAVKATVQSGNAIFPIFWATLPVLQKLYGLI